MTSKEIAEHWATVLNEAKQSSEGYQLAILDRIDFLSADHDHLTLAVPTPYLKDSIENLYGKNFKTKLSELCGYPITIDIKEKPPSASHTFQTTTETSLSPPKQLLPKLQREKHPQLRCDYTFETFVVGDNLAFPANAAMAVSSNPGTSYNPLLLYGGVGLGKTHLMQSIGNRIWYEKPKMKIICITAEDFTNEFTQSIFNKTMQQFKDKYRSIDILLIDDIHFLQKKEGTQEELFHTFNTLHNENKQMVFTCDRPISELKNISDRLKNRFERGLNVDLIPPTYETRCAILKSKIAVTKIIIPDSVVELIATNISTNVRDLEAALTKLFAYYRLVQKPITEEIALNQLRDSFNQSRFGNVHIDSILRTVADHYGISSSDLKGKKRLNNIVFPRQVAMFIAREITTYSTTELGAEFGGRDHTTVMHSCQKIQELTSKDPSIHSTIQSLIRIIKEQKAKQ